jgi:transcriptional regulator with XRE-family HTH domain
MLAISRNGRAGGGIVIQDLKNLRRMAGLTQCDVAKESGVDRSRLSLAENRYVELDPDEYAIVRKILLERIESRATELRSLLSEREAVAV